MSPTFRSLHVRNYRVYAIGSLISNTGTWMQTTAQAWLVLVLTGSGTALGLTVALQLLPTLLLSPSVVSSPTASPSARCCASCR